MKWHFTLFLCALCLSAPLREAFSAPLKWTASWPETSAKTFSIYQGESAAFEPSFMINGVATNLPVAAVWYQTNGMDRAWWRLDSAVFAPSNDVGAAAYRFFVEAGEPGSGKIYRANGTLRMLPSPGFTPNVVAPPVTVLDFSAVEVANAPYYTKAETEEKIVELSPAPDLSPYATTNDLAAATQVMKAEVSSAAVAATNYTDSATTNLNARPVTIPGAAAGRGVTFVDGYGENQNVAIEIGEGARAAVTTNALEAAADNKVVRSAGVAVGGHAEVRNDADPLKIQGVALGWHAQVSAINGVAIGSGAQHTNETGQTSGATVASAPKAIAIGYGAKSSASDAVQLGEGVNSEAGTLKYRDVTIVKNGRVQGGVDEAELLADGFAQLSIVEETNGVKRVTIENDDCIFRVVTETNRADGVALTMGDAEIYGTAAVDSKLAEKADAVRNIIDDRPTFTTNDVWICEWDGQVLSWSKSGSTFLWQNEAGSRGLMRIGNSYNILDVPTHISTYWNGYPDDTASVLDDDYYGWVLRRRNPGGAVTNTVPVAYIDDIPPAVSNTVTKAYVESLGITSEETDPTVPAWAKAASKPTYTASEVGATAPAAVTNIVKGLSLGGIWDSGLEVWWTPVMHNGSLTYQATTNVNLNAEH